MWNIKTETSRLYDSSISLSHHRYALKSLRSLTIQQHSNKTTMEPPQLYNQCDKLFGSKLTHEMPWKLNDTHTQKKKRYSVPGVCERRRFTGCNWSHISAPQKRLRNTRQSAGLTNRSLDISLPFLIGIHSQIRWPVSASLLCSFFFSSYNSVIKTTIVCPLAWEQAGRNSTE